jgi:photosystem II stability/assembly factor-like uncharacterized protein
MALALSAGTSLQAGTWKMQYFYDQEKSSLTINDFQMISVQRGIAVGYILEGKHEEPVSVVTSDGGEHWSTIPLKETPVSLFFLDESLGWMVTTKGLWRTTEAGRNWTKLPKLPEGIVRVCFTSENEGFAVGLKKTVLATHDGGQHWAPVAAAAEQPGDAKYSSFVWIGFATPKAGLITGGNTPPRRFLPDSPEWLDPKATLAMRDVPHLNYTLATSDGGKTWRSASASLFGETSRFRLLPDGRGIGLIEYSELFNYPSEVYKIDWHTGKSVSIYKDPHVSITDVWLAPDGSAYLAGIREAGRLRDIIPGKVVVLKSQDYQSWTIMPVDYRASAIRTMLSAPDPAYMWMATDSGMILKLTADK